MEATVDDISPEIEAIKQLKARYFRLLDTKQWQEMRLQFCDNCSFEGTSRPFSGADAFIESMATHHATTRTVHHGKMPEIMIESEAEARGIWAMTDYVTWDGESPLSRPTVPGQYGWVGYGYYQERYLKEDGLWKIALLRLTRLRVDPLVGDPVEPTDGMPPALDWLPAR